MKIIIPRVSDATTQRSMRSFINSVLQAWFRLPFSSPPTIVSCRLAELLRVIGTQGYTRPIPIQAKASPLILQGHDVQTGTGKTAAFTLPLLQRLNQHAKRDPHPRTLVLTPTRELASQVAASVKTYGKYLSLRSTVIFGGVGINPQKHSLRRGVAILIATPGRLLDLIGQGLLKLSHIEALVLDEADRMLDMGFIREIRKIMQLLPEKRQNLLFSATYSNGIKKLADDLLHKPVLIEVARRNTAAQTVSQSVHMVERSDKQRLLAHMIHSRDWHHVLVFTRTKHGADRLSEQLNRDGITSTAMHGNKSQIVRTRTLQDFKNKKTPDLGRHGHRCPGSGYRTPAACDQLRSAPAPGRLCTPYRTYRTGCSIGTASSLVSPEEHKCLEDIQRHLKQRIPIAAVEGFEHRRSMTPTVDLPLTQSRLVQTRQRGSHYRHRARS